MSEHSSRRILLSVNVDSYCSTIATSYFRLISFEFIQLVGSLREEMRFFLRSTSQMVTKVHQFSGEKVVRLELPSETSEMNSFLCCSRCKSCHTNLIR